MRFELDQPLPGSVDDVIRAFTDEGFLASVGELGKVGAPTVLDRRVDGDLVHQRVHYRFEGDLSPAVTALVDPAKLAWVDEHIYDRESATATFRIVPEHYANRLSCAGTERFESHEGGTHRYVEGELKVRWPLVGSLVERAIVSGLREHLAEEAELVARWIRRT